MDFLCVLAVSILDRLLFFLCSCKHSYWTNKFHVEKRWKKSSISKENCCHFHLEYPHWKHTLPFSAFVIFYEFFFFSFRHVHIFIQAPFCYLFRFCVHIYYHWHFFFPFLRLQLYIAKDKQVLHKVYAIHVRCPYVVCESVQCTCNKLVCCSCAFQCERKQKKKKCSETVFKHMHTLQLSRIHILTHTTVNDMEFFIPHFFLFFSSAVAVAAVTLIAAMICLFCTRILSFYVGHPMKTVLFLALDRPAVSTLTYQSSYSGKTHAIHIVHTQFFFYPSY